MGPSRQSTFDAQSFKIDLATWRMAETFRSKRHLSPRVRFPIMFSGDHLGLTLFRGWNPILTTACGSIERLLSQQELPFHWVQLQEEQGVGCFLYSLGKHCRYAIQAAGHSRRVMILTTQEEARDLSKAIDAIVNEAERLSSEACLVCSARTARRKYFGRELPLCLRHSPELLSLPGEEGLEGVWRRAIEWEAPGRWKG